MVEASGTSIPTFPDKQGPSLDDSPQNVNPCGLGAASVTASPSGSGRELLHRAYPSISTPRERDRPLRDSGLS